MTTKQYIKAYKAIISRKRSGSSWFELMFAWEEFTQAQRKHVAIAVLPIESKKAFLARQKRMR